MRRIGCLVFAAIAVLAATANAQFVKGDFFVSGWGNEIYRVQPGSWTVSSFADAGDGLNGVSALTFGRNGALLASNYNTSSVLEFDSGGSGTTLYDNTTGLSNPFGSNGLAIDVHGDLFVGNWTSHEILRFPAGGGAPTVFADSADGLNHPAGLAFAADGDLFVANPGTLGLLRFDPTGAHSVFDDPPADTSTIVIRGNGDIYVACATGEEIYRYPGGDASRRKLFASFPNNAGTPVLQFNVDESRLYFTSEGTGNLLEIDPDTGSSTEVIPINGIHNASGIAVFGTHDSHWSNYGAGFPGTIGVPSLVAQQDPDLGTIVTIDAGNSYAQPTVGLLLIGTQRIQYPSQWGGDLLVLPMLWSAITFSFGGDSFSGVLPVDPALVGFRVELQVLEADPGAAKGVSFTPGLELVLGY